MNKALCLLTVCLNLALSISVMAQENEQCLVENDFADSLQSKVEDKKLSDVFKNCVDNGFFEVQDAHENGVVVGRRPSLKCSGEYAKELFEKSRSFGRMIKPSQDKNFFVLYINKDTAARRSQCQHDADKNTYTCSFTFDFDRNFLSENSLPSIQECLMNKSGIQPGRREDLLNIVCNGKNARRMFTNARNTGEYSERKSVLLGMPSYHIYSIGYNDKQETSSYCATTSHEEGSEKSCSISVDVHQDIVNSLR